MRRIVSHPCSTHDLRQRPHGGNVVAVPNIPARTQQAAVEPRWLSVDGPRNAMCLLEQVDRWLYSGVARRRLLPGASAADCSCSRACSSSLQAWLPAACKAPGPPACQSVTAWRISTVRCGKYLPSGPRRPHESCAFAAPTGSLMRLCAPRTYTCRVSGPQSGMRCTSTNLT